MNKEELESFKDILKISDEQIKTYLDKLELTPDDKQKEFIKNLDTLDIHAVPGAGKTTMLGVKIACLLDNWNKLKNRNQGICILSHTNTAKNEILKNLDKLGYKKQIQTFPHFIGTIQEFVNRFLALPYLKSKKYSVETIDSEGFIKELFYKLDYGSKAFLKQKIKVGGAGYLNLFLKILNFNEERVLNFSNVFGIRDGADTVSNIKAKFDLGKTMKILPFNFMYIYAQDLIFKNKELLNIISQRFPMCFIDEYQDNNKTQDDLLEQLFYNKSIYQRIGDPNQAIYDFDGDNEKNSFNMGSHHHSKISSISNIDMKVSYRFKGEKIEILLQMFSKNNNKSNANGVIEEDTIIKIIPVQFPHKPNPSDKKGKSKTDKESLDNDYIKKTLPILSNIKEKYTKIIKQTFGENEHKSYNFDDNGNIKFYAVASTGTASNEINIDLKKYFETYDKNKSESRFKPNYWIDCFYLREKEIKEKIDFKIFYDLILEFLAKNCNLGDVKTKTQLKDYLFSNDKLDIYNKGLLRYFSLDSNQKTWIQYIEFIKEKIDIEMEGDFFQFKENEISNDVLPNNTYEKNDIKIKFDTIHNVKGQTHNATLVLTTEFHGLDFDKLMGKIKLKNSNKFMDRDLKRLKNWYVATSRPKHLLCLAIPQSTIDGDNFPENWKQFIYEED